MNEDDARITGTSFEWPSYVTHAEAMEHAAEYRRAFAATPTGDAFHRRHFRRRWSWWMIQAVLARTPIT